MTALALLDTLEGLGVTATITERGTLKLIPGSAVPAELVADIRANGPALLKLLATASPAPAADVLAQQRALTARADIPVQSNTSQTNWPVTVPLAPQTIPVLPPQLQTLLRAASNDQLPSSMTRLANGGMVADLNRYVMAYAVVYLLGDTDHALGALCQVHTTLNGNKGVN
jgi:hypothetical protein